MKKSLLIVLFTISLGVAFTFAQGKCCGNRTEKGKAEMRCENKRLPAEQRADMMAKNLDLTEKEKVEVLTLLQKRDAEHEKRIEERRIQQESQRAEREAVRKANDEELKAIIGVEKFQQYKKIRSENRDKNKNKMNSRKCTRPCEKQAG